MRRDQVFRWGGVGAGAVLIAFGIVVIVLAINGHNTVTNELEQQKITGTPDMTPSAIKAEGAKAGLKDVSYPTCTVAGESVDTGSEARCFAQYMNIHALEATGGYVYSEMGQYQAKPDAPKSELCAGWRHEQSRFRGHRPGDGQACAERSPEHLGDRDGAFDGAQHELHGDSAFTVQRRRRHRAHPRRGRVRHPRARRNGPKTERGADRRIRLMQSRRATL